MADVWKQQVSSRYQRGRTGRRWRERTRKEKEALKGSKQFGACAASSSLSTRRKKKLTLPALSPPQNKNNPLQNQSGVWDLLYGNLDEASVAEHGGGSGGGGGFSASGKNHALADPSRYPYSAVGALFAYRETDPFSGTARAPPPAPSAPRPTAR